jgi:hypothetical protein
MLLTKPYAVLGPTTINIGCNSYINLKKLWDRNLQQFVIFGTCIWQLTGTNLSGPITGTLSYLTGTKGWWQGMITGSQSLPLIAGQTYNLTVTFTQPGTYYATWQAKPLAQYAGATGNEYT